MEAKDKGMGEVVSNLSSETELDRMCDNYRGYE